MEFKKNTAPLEEVIEKFIDYRGKTPKKTSYGIPLITAKVIKKGFVQEVNEFIAEEDYEAWMRRGIPMENDVVLTTEAPLGEVALINTDKKIALAQRVITLRGKEDVLDNIFLKYSLQGPVMQARLRERESGSTVTGIKSSELKKVIIDFPDIEFQKRIGAMLKNLDDKISMNKKMITNLEQLAQTLFKRWFVDFEFPNEDGESYKSSGEEMIESELGEIPKSWTVESLVDIADYHNGLAMQKFRPEDNSNSLPVLKIRELNQGFIEKNGERCKVDIKESAKVYNGDVIFSWSGTLLVKLWVGGNAGLNQHLFKVTSESYPKWFYYYWTKHHLNQFIAIAADKATTMGHIKRSHLSESKVVIPTHKELEKFTKIINPIVEEIIEKGIENNRLQDLRDTLLPKLLSGEIKFPDETEVTEHVSIS